MANSLGRLEDVGIAVEATRGTALAPTYWLATKDKDFDDKASFIDDEAAYGVLGENQERTIEQQRAEGGFTGNVGLNSVGVLFTGLAGASPSTVNSSGEYTHTWAQANNVTNKSLTIAMEDTNLDVRAANCMIDSLAFSLETNKFFEYTAQFIGKKTATSSNTVARTSETLFAPKHAVIKVASAQSGLTAASAIAVRAANITFAKNAEAKQNLGSVDVADVFNRQLSVTGSLEVYYNDATYKDYVFNETERALRISVVNTNVTLPNSSNPKIFIDLYRARFHDWERNRGNNDIVTETVQFTALVDISNSSKVYTIDLLNAHAGTNY